MPLGEGSPTCAACSQAGRCLPANLSGKDLTQLDALLRHRPLLRRGERLHRIGSPLRFLYVVRSGSFKSTVPRDLRSEQVVGYHFPGELVGVEAIHSRVHGCNTIALETASVCAILFDQLEALAIHVPGLQGQLLRLISRELARDHTHQMALARQSAEERLAAFLVSLSEWFGERGYSASGFVLATTRAEIGNYLGLAAETVSRLLTRFQREGWLSVDGRFLQIHDGAALRTTAGIAAPVTSRDADGPRERNCDPASAAGTGTKS